MAITTILFDLDGTLLPMEQERFIKAYLGALGSYLGEYGYDPGIARVILSGTADMLKNDGSRTNEKVFWAKMRAVYGESVMTALPILDRFYSEEFNKVKDACGYTAEARSLIDLLKQKGYRLVLATNPLFPAVATYARIRWAGLSPEDFSYVSVYENSHFSKPNTAYYREILEKLSLDPAECMMVGNDVSDDMVARELGIDVFLLTDNLINNDGYEISEFKQGSFADLIAYFRNQG